jgi:hypothetical protein
MPAISVVSPRGVEQTFRPAVRLIKNLRLQPPRYLYRDNCDDHQKA